MIRLIGLDIDGTILNDNVEISSRVKDTIKKVRNAGVHVALLSGRNYNGMKTYIEELNLKGIAASANGAEIVSIKDEEILLQEVIPYEIAVEVVKDAKILELCNINFSNLKVYTEGFENLPHEYKKILNQEFDQVEDITQNLKNYPSAKLMMIGREQDLFTLQDLIGQKFSKILNADFSTNNLLEVYSNKADKGKALDYIREIFGYSKEETMCIGDSENDVAMFKAAGVSVAMGNALDGVKAYADYITDHIEHDGAAKAMEKYVFTLEDSH